MAGKVKVPAGEKVTISHGKLQVPDHPIIAFIEGDGTGPDIWAASVRVLDAAVAQAYKGRRKIAWAEVYAGEKAQAVYGKDCPPNLLPDGDPRRHPRVPGGDQGPAHHAGRRGLPLAQRDAAPGARSLRLPPARPLVQGRALAGQASREDRHGHLPREHRGHLRRHRVGAGDAGGEEGDRVPPERDGGQEDPLPQHLLHRHQADLQGRARSG